MRLTREQEDIIRGVLTEGGTLLVKAFAGTGKTTACLSVISKALQAGWSVLYLVFNKSMEESARERLSGLNLNGAVIRTAHSFAYYYVKDRLKGPVANPRVSEVAKALSCSLPFASRVLKAYFAFLQSDHPFDAYGLKVFCSGFVKGPFYRGYSPADIEEAIRKFIALVEKGQLPMPHDHYLKLFLQEVAHNLRRIFRVVILDESQDANPAFIELLKKLDAPVNLLVGDPHQRIYGFRNAVQAGKFFEGKRYYLTQSFRFGQEIADVANIFLAFKGEEKRIKGFKNKDLNTTAYICRTNAGVIRTILALNRPVRTERSIEEILRPVVSSLYLLNKKSIESLSLPSCVLDPGIIRAFENPQEFEEYVNDPECYDEELRAGYSFARKLLEKGKEKSLQTLMDLVREDSPVVCTTAHSSKGKEYGKVYVMQDLSLTPEFCLQFQLAREGKAKRTLEELEEEINLRYVACTRATRELHLLASFALEGVKNQEAP